jgi:hypothetical protein
MGESPTGPELRRKPRRGELKLDPPGTAGGIMTPPRRGVTTRTSPCGPRPPAPTPWAGPHVDLADRVVMQGWKGPEGLRREAGEPTVFDDVPAEPAPGPVLALTSWFEMASKTAITHPGRVAIVIPTGSLLVASQTRRCRWGDLSFVPACDLSPHAVLLAHLCTSDRSDARRDLGQSAS